MSERDELAELIRTNAQYSYLGQRVIDAFATANEILAAGYRKPRTITTIGTLPSRVGTVILTAHGKVMVLMAGMENHWQTPDSSVWWSPLVEWLPATVLYESAP